MPVAPVSLPPDDEFNRRLAANVHPPEWENPTPDGRYNLVVIGAGTAGLVTAAVAAGIGAKVALIERHLMGGDCLNVGCVPSKGIIRAARVWASARDGAEFGLTFPGGVQRDFGAVMARMRRLRAAISHVDSAERFKGLGVDVFIGEGRFTGRDSVRVGDAGLRFARAAICTGARATALPIPGLAEAGFLTNETVFSLTSLPRRLAVIGAGPIGCELAQAFARFGSEVTVFELTPHILPREDPDAAAVVQARMERDGVRFAFDTAIDRVAPVADDDPHGGGKRIRYTTAGQASEATVDEILVGVGRAPNVEGLGLEEAGVSYDRSGVLVDACLRTGNPRIYAAGDICSPFKFTHAADAMAQIVIQNALFPHPFGLGMASTESLNIPWCTYTEPEIAHVGMYEADARKKGIEVETFTQPLADVDRAVLDGEDAGFARVHVRKGTDRILGATIVAADAGNLITEVSVAMKAGAGLGTIGATIHPYPTQAEALRKAANQMRKARFSDRQRAILSRLFTWRR
ncbi:MAG: mercuric reductase [Acidobacteria bacterium]|nr:mercuric reductase [Acidobacteriota bacterium]